MAKLEFNKLSQELKDKFRLENSTLIRDVTTNSKDKITLEIGDSKQVDFYPQAKIMRWDNEVNASFRYVDKEPGEPTISTKQGIVQYIKPKAEFNAYEIASDAINKDGGVELELVLKEKPASNKIEFTINSKDLNFFYQPALTQEQIDKGFGRPENIVGSYAAYHKYKGVVNLKSGMEYKVGKAFHIYRPEIVDNTGNKTWGELSIDNDILSVTIDQTWLDNAVYPVIVDPTFGYTSQGASTSQLAAASSDTSTRFGYAISPPERGRIQSMSAYLDTLNAADPITVDVCSFLSREDSEGSGSHGQIASVERLDLSVSASPALYTFTYANQEFPNTTLVLNLLGNGEDMPTADDFLVVMYDSVSPNRNYYQESATGAGSYNTMKESPWTDAATSDTILASIYVTYNGIAIHMPSTPRTNFYSTPHIIKT